MQGDDRRRFCASCSLHVYDLSKMTRAEAQERIEAAGGGRVCVRLFRRPDGTVLFRDCPVGFRQRMRRAFARAGALWLALCSGLSSCVRPASGPTSPAPVAPAPVAPASPPVLMGEVEMGDMRAPDPQPVEPQLRPELGRVRGGGG